MIENRIYFIRPVGQDGPVKIGCSRVPHERVKTLMSWSPYRLEVVASCSGTFKTEAAIHNHFADAHSHGEWFRATPDLTALIAGLAAGRLLVELIDLSASAGRRRIRGQKTFTPEQLRYRSLSARVRCAFRRLRVEGEHYVVEPEDVSEILDRWELGRGNPPSEAELKRIDAVITNPAAFGTKHSLRRLRPDLWPSAAQSDAAA